MKIIKLSPKQQGLDLLFGKIEKDLNAGLQVLLLVPAQFTLRAEEEALARLRCRGFLNLQIMSTNKLQAEILKKQGGLPGKEIDSQGRIMVLRRAMGKIGPKLSAFSKVSVKRDFLKMSGDFLLQLKQNNETVESVAVASAALSDKSVIKNKLGDMLAITKEYQALTDGKFYDAEDRLCHVTNILSHNETIKNSKIYYYGFYSFTPREVNFLAAQDKASRGLEIFLSLNLPEEDSLGAYAAPRRAVKRLYGVCQREGLTFETEVADSCSAKPKPEKHLVSCEGPYKQADYVAAEIFKLVQKEKMNPGEIAVLCSDIAGQGEILKRSLESRGLPVFWDEKRSVVHQKAAIGVCALLDMAAKGIQPGNVSEYISNMPLAAASVSSGQRDEFVKYIESFHIKGKAYSQSFIYGKKYIDKETFEAIDTAREAINKTLSVYLNAENSEKTAEGKIGVLKNFLEKIIMLPEFLEKQALNFAEMGYQDASEESSQIYGCIESILSQAAELLGPEEIGSKELSDLIRDAFTEVKISLLPQSEGKILIGKLGRSQVQGIKALFVCGFNDGLVPEEFKGPAIFTDAETHCLINNNLNLSKNAQMLEEENIYAVLENLRAPEKYLYVTYCLSDAEAKALKPSRLIGRTEELNGVSPEQGEINGVDMLCGKASSLKTLGQNLRQRKCGTLAEISPEFAAAYEYLKGSSKLGMESIEQGLSYTNALAPLKPENFNKLYGLDVVTSATDLENFAKCPFKRFVEKGLVPQKELGFEIQNSEQGTILHSVAEEFVKEINKFGAPQNPRSLWATVKDAQIEFLAKTIFSRIVQAQSEKDAKFKGSAENAYYISRMENIAVFACKQLVIQTRKSKIDRMALEQQFGPGCEIEGKTVTLATRSLCIKGKIDRVDYSEVGSQTYIKIVDYKSGSTRYSEKDAKEGLALQLFLYLESAMQNSSAKPIGVFYYKLRDFQGSFASLEDYISGENPEDIALQAEEFFTLNGPFVNSETETCLMDRGYTGEKKSTTVFESGGKFALSPEEFQKLREELRNKLQEICQKLLSGSIEVKPSKLAKPCAYCEYASVCQSAHLYKN